MSRFTLLLATFFVISFSSISFADDCGTNQVLWKVDLAFNASGAMREDALNSCNQDLKDQITKLTIDCTNSGGLNLVLRTPAECTTDKCYYYGPPVRVYFCKHHNTAYCCGV